MSFLRNIFAASWTCCCPGTLTGRQCKAIYQETLLGLGQFFFFYIWQNPDGISWHISGASWIAVTEVWTFSIYYSYGCLRCLSDLYVFMIVYLLQCLKLICPAVSLCSYVYWRIFSCLYIFRTCGTFLPGEKQSTAWASCQSITRPTQSWTSHSQGQFGITE